MTATDHVTPWLSATDREICDAIDFASDELVETMPAWYNEALQMSCRSAAGNSLRRGQPVREADMPDHTTSSDIPLKRCPKCGESKPATTEYFCRDKHAKDGFCYCCKVCHAISAGVYRAANKEREAASDRAYYQANKERINERGRAWYAANREYCAERWQVWYKANREHRSQYSRAYNAADPARKPKWGHAWYVANKERVIKRNRAYNAANRDKRRAADHRYRARIANAEGTHTEADIQAQYQRQKGKCYYCGVKLNESYHVDHIVPLSRGGTNTPDNLVCACASCNSSKSDKLPHEWPQGGRLL